MKQILKKGILALMMVMVFSMAAPSVLPQEMQTVEAASVKISKSKLTLVKGATSTLKITGTSAKVKWSSNKKSVATVSSKGKVTAKKKGTATITAKVNGKKYTCKVKVEAPKISATSVTLIKGETTTLKMSGTTKKVTWSSSDKSVATVSSKGKVTAKGAGTTTITAKVGGKNFTCSLTVAARALTISSNSVSITDTGSDKVTLNFIASGTVSYKIADTSIVSCSWGSWSGYDVPLTITGKKVGSTTVTITNTYNSETCTVNVTVNETAVTSLVLSSSTLTLEDGDSSTLSATISPSNATNQTVTWTSSDPSIATVNASGRVTAISCGTATITAQVGNKTATCEVTVYVPVNISLPEVPVSICKYSSSLRLQKMCKVTDVWYEVSKSGSQYYYKIYISGEKLYDSSGSSISSSCPIGYKIYDENDAVVKSGTISSTAVCVGEKFSGSYTNGYLDAGDYTLVLLDVQ
ncbi:MAG: Ig-like domain-containing protein [Clostridiales bacterium]|nr:Ig-like domain-containing protein [Clostridiales bacterium]